MSAATTAQPSAEAHDATTDQHTSPVIGVLCIDVTWKIAQCHGDKIRSYVYASYVRFLEAAGMCVVPIWIGRDYAYYEQIMGKISGILLPGGGVFYEAEAATAQLPNDCVASSRVVYEVALKLNKGGCYFPIWGTCMGFQFLLLHSAKIEREARTTCGLMNVRLPLRFEADFRDSNLFRNIDDAMVEIMLQKPIGCHFHKYCITKEQLAEWKVKDEWRVLASEKNCTGLEFINIIEHRSYPFYGSQIHPERVFDDVEQETTCRQAALYFARFLAQECAKCENSFATKQELDRHLIANFPVTHEANEDDCYLFESNTDYPR